MNAKCQQRKDRETREFFSQKQVLGGRGPSAPVLDSLEGLRRVSTPTFNCLK